MDNKKQNLEENVVFIGKKPVMSYVLSVVTQFADGKDEVKIKARGHAINKAVDVAEIVKNKFVQNLQTGNIKIGTDEITADNNEKISISTIEIMLKK